MRGKAALALFAFAVAMACFALLARAVDATGVAQVRTVTVSAQAISHEVQAQGVVARRGETTAPTVSSSETGLVFEATVTGDEASKLEATATGTVRFSDDLLLKGVAFSIAKVSGGTAHLSANVDAEGVTDGMTGKATITLSTNDYTACLPLAALHQDGLSQYFVYVLEDKDGFLGTEQVARAASVTVLDTGGGYAALSDGALSFQQQVIVRSDRVIAEGDKVRPADA